MALALSLLLPPSLSLFSFSLLTSPLSSSSPPGSTRAASQAAAAAAASPARGRAEGVLARAMRCVVVVIDVAVEVEREGLERTRGGLPGRSMLLDMLLRSL